MITTDKENTEYNFEYLEHVLHFDNLESVLTHGLLSYNQVYQQKLITCDISMNKVQEKRHRRNIKIENKSYNVHDFVSFYFNSRNPMMYKRRNIQDELIIILINADILNSKLTDTQFAKFVSRNYASML